MWIKRQVSGRRDTGISILVLSSPPIDEAVFGLCTGVACDVEFSIYLPFLEEIGYLSKDRLSSGGEIREHVSRIVQKRYLASKVQLQTEIHLSRLERIVLRWHVYTNRSDHIISQSVVLATGTLHEPKPPGFPGFENSKRDHFP